MVCKLLLTLVVLISIGNLVPSAAVAVAAAQVHVDIEGSVSVGGDLWLSAAASPRLFCDGRWLKLGKGVLLPPLQGEDSLGSYSEQARSFAAADGGTGVELALKTYGEHVDTFVLEQRLRNGCKHTQANPVPRLPSRAVETADTDHPGAVPPFLSFPAWDTEEGELQSLNFLTWQGGNHALYQWTVQESHGRDITQAHSDGTFGGLAGLSSGPVVLMKTGPNRTALPAAVVVGPISNPKLATSVIPEVVWEIGVSSEVKSVPAGFVHRTLLTAAAGPTRAMLRWGELAQQAADLAGKGGRFEDIATSKLGYFTDNGAMLYGDAWGLLGQKHGGNLDCCNESVMRSVTAGLAAQNIPYNWIQMDDWWYTGYFPSGGGVFCTHDWTPWPHAFPGGLDAVQTKLPLVCGRPRTSTALLPLCAASVCAFPPTMTHACAFGPPHRLLYAPFFCANSTWCSETLRRCWSARAATRCRPQTPRSRSTAKSLRCTGEQSPSSTWFAAKSCAVRLIAAAGLLCPRPLRRHTSGDDAGGGGGEAGSDSSFEGNIQGYEVDFMIDNFLNRAQQSNA